MKSPHDEIKGFKMFWAAMSLTGISGSQSDLADVSAFVLSQGNKRVSDFYRQLGRLHEIAAESGLRSAIQEALPATLGRNGSDDEVDRAVEHLASFGILEFAKQLETPDLEAVAIKPLSIGLTEAIKDPELANGGDDRRKYSRNFIPLRRDGSSWISVEFGYGVGVRANDWPFKAMEFRSRFDRTAAICSQLEAWQDIKKRAVIRDLTIVIEYWPRASDAKRLPRVARVSPAIIEVEMARDAPPKNPSNDAREVGDRESWSLLDDAFSLLAKSDPALAPTAHSANP